MKSLPRKIFVHFEVSGWSLTIAGYLCVPLLAAAEVWRRGGAAFSCSAGWRPAGGGDWRLWRGQRWGAQEAQGAQETQEAQGAQETQEAQEIQEIQETQEAQEAQEAAAEMQDMETCDAEAADIMGDYFENVVHQDLERSTNMFRNI